MICERCQFGTGFHAKDCAEPAPRLGRAMLRAENPRARRLVLQAVARAVFAAARRLDDRTRSEFASVLVWSRHRRDQPPWHKWERYHDRLRALCAVPRVMTPELAPVALAHAFAIGMRADRVEFARDRTFAGLLVFEAVEAIARGEGEGHLAFAARARAELDAMHTRAAKRQDARPPR